MNYLREDDVQWPTALAALNSYDNRRLTQLSRAFVGKKPPTRKDDMVAGLMRLLDPDHLPELWKMLTPLEQSAAAETAWSRDGKFQSDLFRAKYGKPLRPRPQAVDVMSCAASSRNEPSQSLLNVIQPQNVMPRDIQTRVRQLVPKPPAAKIKTIDTAPEYIVSPTYKWNEQREKSDEGTEQVPVEQRKMERTAAHDLLAVLHLAGTGKLSITDKNRWPTPSSLRAIAEVLDGGDFYPAPARKSARPKDDESDDQEDEEETAGPIRAFAWPMLLQAGGLVKAHGNKLALTKAGREALTELPHVTLRALWESWVDNPDFDELRRINVIRGQTGKGKRWLTSPEDRREAIAAVLAECPVERWI